MRLAWQGLRTALPTLRTRHRSYFSTNIPLKATSDTFESFANAQKDSRGIDYSLFEPEYPAERDERSAELRAQHEGAESPSAALMRRLIDAKDFDTASVYLHELRELGPVTALPEYSIAALWAMQNGKEREAQTWMQHCPSYYDRYMRAHQGRQTVGANFVQVLQEVVRLHGANVDLVQQTSLIAARKGYLLGLDAPFLHVIRYGGSGAAPKGWNFFLRLIVAAVEPRPIRRHELFSSGIKTLTIADDLASAVGWVESGHELGLMPAPFTQRMLMEELRKAKRDDLIGRLDALRPHPPYDFLSSPHHEPLPNRTLWLHTDPQLNREMLKRLERHDAVGARNVLLDALDDAIADPDAEVCLPNAAVLSQLQRRLVPAEMHVVRKRLATVRSGTGLWQTAVLFGLVQRRKWTQAVEYYARTFQLQTGGITVELLHLVLPQRMATTGTLWPSTYALALVLKAIANLCIESEDFGVLQQAYRLWRDASVPNAAFQAWPLPPTSYSFDPFLRAFARLRNSEAGDWGSSTAVFEVLKDMTETFHVQPTISSWTIALDCLAREGRSRWTTTTEPLARSVGINTREVRDIDGPSGTFPAATMITYAALMHGLLRDDMLVEAGLVRDDLLRRISDLDAHDDPDADFWSDALRQWRLVRDSSDPRPQWTVAALLDPTHNAFTVLREVYETERQAVSAS